jgi:uncharacterized protein YciI
MYAIAIIRYRRPIDEIEKVTADHRAYLGQLKERGVLIAAGPFDPRLGGALLLRVPDSDVITTLDRIRDEDPYIRRKVAQYEILPWNVMGGREDLDKI